MNRIVPISSVAEFHRREEEQDSYQKEALRRFYERERPYRVDKGKMFWFFVLISMAAIFFYGLALTVFAVGELIQEVVGKL